MIKFTETEGMERQEVQDYLDARVRDGAKPRVCVYGTDTDIQYLTSCQGTYKYAGVDSDGDTMLADDASVFVCRDYIERLLNIEECAKKFIGSDYNNGSEVDDNYDKLREALS